MKTDEGYMNVALILAKEALDKGNPPVGSVVVLQDKIIGKGSESGKSTGDITNHAEILSIRNAFKGGFSHQLANSTLYTTHEPCIMCSYLIRHYKIKKIVYGISVDHVGGYTSDFNILNTHKVPIWDKAPEIVGGILEMKCRSLNDLYHNKNK